MSLKIKALCLTLVLVLMGGMILGSTVLASENEQRAEYAAPIMVVNASFLNVRTGPGAYYSILTTVVGGSELPVLGVARDGVWYQVSTLAGIGWINSEYAVGRGDFSHVPLVEAPPIDVTAYETSAAGMPGTSGAVAPAGYSNWGISVVEPHGAMVGNLGSGWTVAIDASLDVLYPIIDIGGLYNTYWYRIHTDWAGDVWVDSTKSILRPFGCNNYVVSFPGDVILSAGPDNSGTAEGAVLLAGNEAILVDRVANFYKMQLMDGGTGWAMAVEINIREPGAFPELCTGAVAAVSSTTGAPPGTTTTAAQPAALTSARVVVNTGHLNIRSGPGAQYTIIATVAGGTELPVTGFAPDGVWYRVAGDFGQGWLNSEFTLFRGDGRFVPIIRGVVGVLANPMATITNAVTLYAAPNNTMGVIGALSGPLEVPVVARTQAFDWVQLNTALGYGWVQANQVQLSGDTSLIPVVGN